MSSIERKHKRRKGLVFNKAGDILIFKINKLESHSSNPEDIIIFATTEEIFKAADYVPQVLLNNVLNEFIVSKSGYQDPDS